MPYKKRNKNRALEMRQEKCMKKRLMEVSLCVDNYIYKKKSIELQRAQEYIKEISLYKTEHTTDARSLQVIEKLTRCLKSIIQEITEQHHLNINLQGNGNYHQNAECSFKVDLKNKVGGTNMFQYGNNLSEINNQDTATIEISSESDSENNVLSGKKIHLTHDSRLAINKAFMKTKDNENINILPNETNQRVNLINFKNYIDKNHLNINCPIRETSPNQYLIHVESQFNSNEFSNAQTIYVIDKMSDRQERNEGVIKNEQIQISTAIENLRRDIQNVTIRSDDSKQRENPLTIKKQRIELLTDDNVLNVTIHEVPKSVSKIKGTTKTNKRNKIITNTQKELNKKKRTPKNAVKKTMTESTVRRKTKVKMSNTKNITNMLSEESKNKKAKRHNTVNIMSDETAIPITCNKNKTCNALPTNQLTEIAGLDSLTMDNKVENHLSWVEGISHVREVSADEFELNPLLEETFWKNFSLPSGWSNEEFFE